MKTNNNISLSIDKYRPVMASSYAKIAIALSDKPKHTDILLGYIASFCKYSPEMIYDTRKGERAFMLRKTGIKHEKAFRRAINNLIQLGLIIRIGNACGGTYRMYQLTENAVKIAKDFGYKICSEKAGSAYTIVRRTAQKG